MIKQVYDNRVDEILDNLKTRITKEPFVEDIGPLVDNYVKMTNIQIRSVEVTQKRDFEILQKLEKDLKYYKNQEKKEKEKRTEILVPFYIRDAEDIKTSEFNTIILRLNELREFVDSNYYHSEIEIENYNHNIESIQSLLNNFKIITFKGEQ